MRVLVVANHFAVASGRYMADALRRMGHSVRTVGDNQGATIWGMTVDERYVWLAERPEATWTPDLVIVADSAVPWQRFGDCPHVVYGVDNHVRDYAHCEADHFFLAHGHGHRIGEANVTWLPCGYDPQWFTPGPAWDARPVDVAMLGVMYGPRAELLYALRERLPHVSAWYGTGALYDQYAAAYQGARLSLVRSVANDVAQRVWETAAMGCLVIMDEVADCEALGLVHEANCLLYHTPDEAMQLIGWALTQRADAAAIAQAGQQWALPGTWDARLQVILDWARGVKAPVVESETHETRD